MAILLSLIFGAIQGLTEFLPISSSGHLVIAHDLLRLDFIDNLSFDIALHLGTLLALLLYFYREIFKLILSFFKSFANWNLAQDINQRLAWFLLVGTIPGAVAGYLVEDWAGTVFRNLWLVAILLVAVGALFILVEKKAKQDQDLSQLPWRGAIFIGLAQVLALLPGVSRSGITISAGMGARLSRREAARFSFLLSVPIIFGAGLKQMIEVISVGLDRQELTSMVVGLIGAAVVGYLTIHFLLKFLSGHSLKVFAYYRFILAGALLVYLVLR